MSNIKVKAVICGFVFSILFSFTSFAHTCDGITTKVFRLHIIANSDTHCDQELKLMVRDRILKDFGIALGEAEDVVSAQEITRESLGKIECSACDEIIKNGYDYSVKAKLVHMNFNVRRYGDITLPAGDYNALRITIGKGAGKNWWCVMFPPMCVPAAYDNRSMEGVLNSHESDIVKGYSKYEIAFKVLEIFSQAKEFICDNIYEPLKSFFDINGNCKFEAEFKSMELFRDFI